jgi:phosphoglycolate phosphatase-like HAD superfamily hydrolase
MKGLVLFDIDGTLIKSGSGNALAFSNAFKQVYGIEGTMVEINHHGMTDQQIIIEVLKKKGFNEYEIMLRMKECIGAIAGYFNEIKDSISIEVLEGVPKLLAQLERKDYLLGLVTGNIEPIARGKLERACLNQYFKLGGFGSDGIKRADLVKIAIGKAMENFGLKPANNIFLFGDTPKDINAGKEAGVIALGIATGIYSRKELEEAGADYALDNLRDTKKILRILNKENKMNSYLV